MRCKRLIEEITTVVCGVSNNRKCDITYLLAEIETEGLNQMNEHNEQGFNPIPKDEKWGKSLTVVGPKLRQSLPPPHQPSKLV